jgi:hypothetical protein
MRSDLLIQLNQTGLSQRDPVLYQLLKSLSDNSLEVHSTVTNISGGGGGGGGTGNVTTTVGGTASTLAMFTTSVNIENASAAAVSAALDLL